MAEPLFCISTKERITNDIGRVIFPCPKCDSRIVRSSKARKIAIRYKCPSCGFEGPN